MVFGQINKTRGSAWDSGPCVMTFPQDLEVGMKAVLLGVLVLVVRIRNMHELTSRP